MHVPADRSNGTTANSPLPRERIRDQAREENTPPLTTRQSERWHEIKKLEASIENAMRGNWRDLRTVFNAVGLTPPKPPTSQKTSSKNGSSPRGENAWILARGHE
jgi:hypothetical protein